MQRKELNQYPQPAILAVGERLVQLNDKAETLFPELTENGTLPEVLQLPDESEKWEGYVTLAGRMYRVAATREGEQTLYLLQPREQQALGEAQMDGALYQVRTLMGQFRRELAPYVAGERERFRAEDLEQFSKSYYRMLRLMDHMDLLRDAAAGQLIPDRQTLDLDRLCGQIALECTALLDEQKIKVDYDGTVGVVISGDEELLRNAVLELISNCAKRRRNGGEIKLRLSKKGTWVRICITDDGPPATDRERLALTTRGAMPLIPTADMGAGLGLSAAETVVRLHAGALLIHAGERAPSVYLALPTKQQPGESVSLRAPRPARNLGMNPYLIALSDVLSGAVIREDWKE